MKNSKLIIVDENLPFQQSLIFLLNVEGKVDVIGKACYGFEFDELLSHTPPDLILLDIDNPYIDGIDIVRKALHKRSDLRIIAFTMFRDENYINRMIELGVIGFIQKSKAVLMNENEIHAFQGDENSTINTQLLEIINKLLSNELKAPVVFTNSKENTRSELYRYN